MYDKKLNDKLWREKNKESLKEKRNLYRQNNKERLSQYGKEWREKNKGEYLVQQKSCYQNNREKRISEAKKYRVENIEKVKEKQREYYNKNKNSINKKVASYQVNRYHSDPVYRITVLLRNRLKQSLKKSGSRACNKTLDYVGCGKEELKQHLESQFTEGMTWDNHGTHGWHIDHIRPLTNFDLTKESEIFIAMNYTNLQPLWAAENILKSNKTVDNLLDKSN